MQGTAEVDQPIGLMHQRREDERRQGIHSQYGGMTVGRRTAASLSINTRVVDHGVHAPDRVDLFRDTAGFGGAAKIADHDAGGT